ncbi:MAG: carboxypeptidase-like regulatory domain-containing protein [Myxococcales bacterium]|nr:carboxypeptidase-like regulatory domain-containing protein [Myxococcota bacterium]MDW8281887.1 carboxypeptidase-like regulatory domain-containing protein [Myxococcales bacterium]
MHRARWIVLLLLLLSTPATAQPAMPDPAMMSGIPRPDPQVAPGTITVRLVRGELSNRLVDVEVELWTLSRKEPLRTAKTDAEGRATFSGLSPGTYEARAVVDGEALASQPIELPDQPGMRVMLVFSKSVADQHKEVGTPDGKARVSLDLPPGTLVVRVVDEQRQALAGLRVELHHGDRDTEKVDTLPEVKTDQGGEARFTGLKTGPGDGYLVTAYRDGSRCRSKPFRLVANHGSHVTIECRLASRDLSQLRIGAASHIILELQDDTVQGVENLRLQNPLEQPIDPGPGGLRLPLPEGALSPQLVQQEGQNLPVHVDVSQAGAPPALLWKGPIPPGDTDLRVGFLLKHRGTLRFRQATPVAFEAVRVIAEKSPEMQVEGPGFDSEERKWQGRDLLLVTGPAPSAGGVIEFTVTGLPYQAPLGRYLAGLIALAVAVGFGLAARRSAPGGDQVSARRERLERRRRELLDTLARIEGTRRGRPAADREQMMAELEQIYRELDQIGTERMQGT